MKSLIRIICLALALVLALAGCAGKPAQTGSVDESTPDVEPGTTGFVEDAGGDYIIAKDGEALCKIVTSTASGKDGKVLAVSIQTALKNEFGVNIEVVEGDATPGEREIVIGCGVAGVNPDAYAYAKYGLWGTAASDGKLVVFAMDSKSYSAAASLIPNYIKRSSKDGDVRLSKAYFGTEVKTSLPVGVPEVDGAVAAYVQHTGGRDTSKKCTSVSFTGAYETLYDNYCEKLASLNYEKKFENRISGNRYAAFVNDGEMLTVDYFPTMRVMRVISEPAYETPVWDLPSGERTAAVKLFQIEDTTSDHASCFIVTLGDGRYLLYDTGVEATADQAHEYMQKNNRFTDGRIHIAAIVISHPHTDHMDGLSAYAKKYAADTVCDAVMYNLVSVDMQKVLSTDSLNSRQTAFNEAAKKLGATVYCLRGGQKFTLSGTDFEVLFTADELGDFALTGVNASGETDTTYDMNNSSLIFRMTESGQTTVFTGDCRGGEAGIISDMFAKGFKADMMTVAHHGFNVVATLWMYKTAAPKVLFWTIKSDKSDTTRSFVKQLMSAGYVIKHFYEDEAVEITLPYDPAG